MVELASFIDPCKDVKDRFDVKKAIKAQKHLSRRIILEDSFSQVRFVAGLDVSYPSWRYSTWGIGVAVALSFPRMEKVSCIAAVNRVCVPYIPGLLAFREMAVLAPAFNKLLKEVSVDLVIVDGHGIAHPRKAGIATHVGVVFDIPSIGVAKKRLTGQYVEVYGEEFLEDDNGNKIAAVLGKGSKRIFVSPGHKVSLSTSAKLVQLMRKRGKLPEPTRIADQITKELRRRITSPPREYPVYIRC